MRWTAVPCLPWLPVVVVFAFVVEVASVRASEAANGGGAGAGSGGGGGSRSAKSRRQYFGQPKERRPNIVLIMTDDQDVELGSLNFMPRTLRLLRDGGAQFRHAYTTTPMCCPSRSSMLTGMYMHNHEVYTNNGNCSSAQWQATHETRTFATYLSNAGYRTGYFGKYLNKYNGSYIPPGWREWGGLIMNSRYYNYSVNLNGRKIKHGDDYYKDYYPDLIANDSVTFLRQSKQYFSRKPVMLVLGFPAPHGPEDSAPQYSNLFFNVTSHHTPSYDYAPNPDKQWILQVTGQMQPIHRQFTDLLMTKRLQTLQSVDDAVDKVYQELKALGELENTYIIYTSDHGYHLGQFGLVKGKSFPFEFDVRVPFLVRGPGIEPGTIIDELVLNIDLAPTFLDIAGVESPSHMDGRSFLKLLNRRHKSRSRYPAKWPDTFLIESSGRRDVPDQNLVEAKLKKDIDSIEKNLNQTLIHSLSNEEEKNLGDLSDNSTLTDNGKLGLELNESLPVEKAEEELNRLVPSNEGHEMEVPPVTPDSVIDNQILPVVTGLSKLERLAIECQRPEYQPPCKHGQKWQCLAEGTRWRKHKCKIRPVLYPPVRGKKCACFTPSGIMYTRFEPPEERVSKEFIRSRGDFSKPKYVKSVRNRRSPEFGVGSLNKPSYVLKTTQESEDGEETEELGEEDMKVLGSIYEDRDIERAVNSVIDLVTNSTSNGILRRVKRSDRESLDSHVSNIMGVLQHKINGLKFPGNSTSLKITPDGNCTVGYKGEVSCSDAIYHDPKAWKASRDRLEEQIRRLKIQLEKLKEIRKHLKEKRPPQPPYDHSIEEEDTFKLHDFDKNKEDEFLVETTTSRHRLVDSAPRPTNRRRHHHDSEMSYPMLALPGSRDQENRGRHGTGRIDFGTLESPFLPKRPKQSFLPDTCYCEPDPSPYKDEKELAKEARRRIKEERLKKKDRKLRKKAKMESECLSEKMNCFNHDNDHWKTAPFWTEGPFCFCMNANNNTYSCIRTINATHNFLYCEFVTGLKTYYNLRIDPFEQWNRFHTLTSDEKNYLHDQLDHMKKCKGTRDCTVGYAQASYSTTASSLPVSNGGVGRTSKRLKYLQSSGFYVPSFYSHSYSSRLAKHPERQKYRKKDANREWGRRHGDSQWKSARRKPPITQASISTSLSV